MAKYFSDSQVGLSSLPTNSHVGMVMAHRCVVPFRVDTPLSVGDVLVLGVLPLGYTVESIKADSDGIEGLAINVKCMDSLDGALKELTLVDSISLGEAAQVAGQLTLAAIKDRGENTARFLVAEVTAEGKATKGQEVGVTVGYRFRQVAY